MPRNEIGVKLPPHRIKRLKMSTRQLKVCYYRDPIWNLMGRSIGNASGLNPSDLEEVSILGDSYFIPHDKVYKVTSRKWRKKHGFKIYTTVQVSYYPGYASPSEEAFGRSRKHGNTYGAPRIFEIDLEHFILGLLPDVPGKTSYKPTVSHSFYRSQAEYNRSGQLARRVHPDLMFYHQQLEPEDHPNIVKPIYHGVQIYTPAATEFENSTKKDSLLYLKESDNPEYVRVMYAGQELYSKLLSDQVKLTGIRINDRDNYVGWARTFELEAARIYDQAEFAAYGTNGKLNFLNTLGV